VPYALQLEILQSLTSTPATSVPLPATQFDAARGHRRQAWSTNVCLLRVFSFTNDGAATSHNVPQLQQEG
jgi:hypothetical protein